MADFETVWRLERLADDAWPPAVVEEHDGWALRWAEGPWNRTNSVSPRRRGQAPLAAKIDHAERWYAERGRRAVFKLSAAAQPPDLDTVLERRGYGISFGVSVQAAPNPPAEVPGDVMLASRPTAEWLEAKRRIAGVSSERARHLPSLLARITAPAAYAHLAVGSVPVALGLAVVTSAHVGIFDLAVDVERRRRGLASRILRALTAWGAELSADTAYLQVEETNEPALALYRKLGYVEVYRYWYRAIGGHQASGITHQATTTRAHPAAVRPSPDP